ncbi:MAG: EF-hand domain-containing protein, partial [Gemmataceae bacterium]|nr:EF-hand domain-containing protein [Gemmataceae bacterium]
GPGGGGPPGGGFGGFGMGRGRGISPEQGWQGLQFLTGSSGDTVDLGKIPPQTRAMLNSITERMGGLPLPESGIMTKDQYMDFFARSEAARMARAEAGGGGDRGRGPGGFDPGSWGSGGWGNWGQGNWGGWSDPNRDSRNSDRRQPTNEERPVAMRYGKLPQGLPNWFNELDVDKDGQVGLYEWRKAGKDLKEFMEMDLNGDGLVTADEYLRFARLKNIETKVAAYESGERDPGNWGLGEKLDSGSSSSNGKGSWGSPGGFGNWGPPGGGFGGWGPPGGGFGGWGSPGEKGEKGEKGGKGDKDKGDKGSKGNPWQPRR